MDDKTTADLTTSYVRWGYVEATLRLRKGRKAHTGNQGSNRLNFTSIIVAHKHSIYNFTSIIAVHNIISTI